MENTLVSVCIPLFNAGKYISETLASIVKQSHRNIEIIVSDNASGDNSEDIIKGFAARDKRIKYFRNETNIDYVNNINKLVGLAASEYIAIYHADDIYEETIIEDELAVLVSNKGMGGVFVKHKSFYEDSKRKKIPGNYSCLENSDLLNEKGNYYSGGLKEYLPLILKYWNFFVCPSFMTKKTVYKESGGFSDKYQSNEDLDLWLRILGKGYSLAIVNEYLINYRRTEAHAIQYDFRPELPVFYKVIDDFLKNSSFKVEEQDILNYKKNKAKGFLDSAFNAYIMKDMGKVKYFISESEKEYNYLLSKPGLIQKIPGLYFLYKKIIQYIKNNI